MIENMLHVQYKSKHINYVKLSILVHFPLDTHSWHPFWPNASIVTRKEGKKERRSNMKKMSKTPLFGIY